MSETLRLLQIEDSESDAAMVLHLLERDGYTVQSKRVEAAEPMRQALARQDWDVVIADNQLPQFDAAAALKVLHESGRDIPFIIVSGAISPDHAVAMMRAGAHDYVLKDRIARLVPVVRREVQDAQSRRDRREAEARLRDRDEWLALVVSVTHIAMYDFYPQSGKVIWTGDVRSHFGLPPDAEVTHETFLQALHRDDRERVEGLIRKAFDSNSGGEYAAEYRIVGITDHVERWLAARGRVFFDSTGTPIRFVGVTNDISEQKHLEEQFRQAQKLESVGRLAGGIAHDFNNLLTIISGYSQMTLNELPPLHPVRENVDEVLKAAAQAANLTRQLLTFSRRERSRIGVIVLNDLVANIENMLGRLVGADVNLVLHLESAAGSIRADTGQIEQVIMNLAVNARDAMPNGGTLSIKTAHRLIEERIAESHANVPPGAYAALTVGDTGTGISPEVAPHIFDPFFTTKPPGKGTGLGLSTVYGIVKKCGGSILVNSQPGRGTEFTLLFPTVEAQAGDGARIPAVSLTPGTETVLLAEDQLGVRRFVRTSLEQGGYRVIECSTGLEAIERARRHSDSIHLLLTDAVMPDMGGAELAKQFAVCCPGVPVICMSGYSDLVWPEAATVDSYLQKPFTAEALLLRVRTSLDHKQTVPVV